MSGLDRTRFYDTLLPYARAGTAGFARGELDPTRPFIRPMAATPRRGAPAPAPPATAGPTTLSPSEAQAVTGQAAELAQAGQFSQATDILTAVIGRCATDDALADELRFSLANVLFVAGSYRRALTEFETAGARLARSTGAGWPHVLARVSMASPIAGYRWRRAAWSIRVQIILASSSASCSVAAMPSRACEGRSPSRWTRWSRRNGTLLPGRVVSRSCTQPERLRLRPNARPRAQS